MNLLKNTIFVILVSVISFSAFADFKLAIKNNLNYSLISNVGILNTADVIVKPYNNINDENPLLPKRARVIARVLNANSLGFGVLSQVNLNHLFLQCIDSEHHQCHKPKWYLTSTPLITPILSTVPVVIGSEIFETTKVILILKNVNKLFDSPIITPSYLRIDYRVIRKSTTTNAINRTNGTLGHIHVFNT